MPLETFSRHFEASNRIIDAFQHIHGYCFTTKCTPVRSQAPYGAGKEDKGNFRNDIKPFVAFVVNMSRGETDHDWY